MEGNCVSTLMIVCIIVTWVFWSIFIVADIIKNKKGWYTLFIPPMVITIVILSLQMLAELLALSFAVVFHIIFVIWFILG